MCALAAASLLIFRVHGPPPHNLVIHPRPLPVNKCCRPPSPVCDETLFAAARRLKEPAGIASLCLSVWQEGKIRLTLSTQSDKTYVKCEKNQYDVKRRQLYSLIHRAGKKIYQKATKTLVYKIIER